MTSIYDLKLSEKKFLLLNWKFEFSRYFDVNNGIYRKLT